MSELHYNDCGHACCLRVENLAVTIGGSAFGVLGMLVMVPAGSVLYSLVRENTAKRLKQRGTPPKKYR